MLHYHGQQFGIHLSQDTPRFQTAGLVDAPLALPQLEQEFDLPPGTPEHEGFSDGQALNGHVRHQHGPGRQGQTTRTYHAPLLPGGGRNRRRRSSATAGGTRTASKRAGRR